MNWKHYHALSELRVYGGQKNGKRGSKQNHICTRCGRQFIDAYDPKQGYSTDGYKVYPSFIEEGVQIISGLTHLQPEILILLSPVEKGELRKPPS
jgi:transposase-like protein